MGDISTISPRISSTRSVGLRMPTSPIRWYSSRVKSRRAAATSTAIGVRPQEDTSECRSVGFFDEDEGSSLHDGSARADERGTSLTWRSPARPDACSAPSIWWVSRRFARSAIAARSVRTAVESLRDDGPRLGLYLKMNTKKAPLTKRMRAISSHAIIAAARDDRRGGRGSLVALARPASRALPTCEARSDGAPACAAILTLRQPGAFTFRRAGTHYHRPPGRSCRVAGEHGGASVESAYRERAQRARAVSLHEPLDLPPHRR